MIDLWHQLVDQRKVEGLDAILADDVVLHSPVVHSAIRGKAMVQMYLTAAFHTFLNDSFHYVRQFPIQNQAVLEFEVEIDGIFVNGVDMISWNSDGKITDFKVMIRPLQAVNLIHQLMQAMLAQRGA